MNLEHAECGLPSVFAAFVLAALINAGRIVTGANGIAVWSKTGKSAFDKEKGFINSPEMESIDA